MLTYDMPPGQVAQYVIEHWLGQRYGVDGSSQQAAKTASMCFSHRWAARTPMTPARRNTMKKFKFYGGGIENRETEGKF
jgi:hypothetical protein